MALSERWDDERRRYLSMFSSIGIVLGLFYFMQGSFYGARYLPFVHGSTVVTMVAAKIVSRRARWTGWGTIIFLVGIHNLLFFSSILDGLTRAPGLWAIAALPMTTAFLSGVRATTVASIVALMDVLAIYWLEQHFTIVREVEALPNIVLITMLCTIFLFSLFSFLTTSSSFSKIQRMEREKAQLQAANRESLHAFEEKKTFLAKMSHEIRTPMNGLLGCARELQGIGREGLGDIAAQVQRDADNLLVALDVCLDTSDTTQSSVSVSSHVTARPVDLLACLNKSAEKIERLPQWSQIRRDIELEPSYRFCQLDPGRFEQLLLNVAAALPASHVSSGPVMRVRMVPEGNPSTQWIEVELGGLDHKVELDDTLGSFSGGQDLLRTSLDVDCVSLDQAVSLQLSYEMGAVPLVTRDGPELMVGVRIPFVAAQAPQKSRPALQAPGKMLQVLVVDDNAINLKVASLLLKRAGCSVQVAQDGSIAVQKARASRFDLILMDMRMPVMGGVEATRSILTSCPVNVRTPIVALTANAFEADRRACLEAGMVDHLAKPLKPDALARVLSRYCDLEVFTEERRCA